MKFKENLVALRWCDGNSDPFLSPLIAKFHKVSIFGFRALLGWGENLKKLLNLLFLSFLKDFFSWENCGEVWGKFGWFMVMWFNFFSSFWIKLHLLFGTWLDWGENLDKVEETVELLLLSSVQFSWGIYGFWKKNLVGLRVMSFFFCCAKFA